MAGGNSTISSSKTICDPHLVSSLNKSMGEKAWRVNALQIASAILARLIVGIGTYGQRYRHQRFTRFIFLGATTLFLAVISTVVPMAAGSNDYAVGRRDMDIKDFNQLIAECDPGFAHPALVVVWASLVQIIMINTSAVVAVDVREGGNMGPPFDLFVKGVWTFYLGVSYIILWTNRYSSEPEDKTTTVALEVVPFALICTKMVFKYYAFEKARQSFAFGRNPHLIFGYMKQQLSQQTSHHGEQVVTEDAPPPLLVMGEEKRHVEKQPLGYVFKDDSWTSSHKNGLVTIDRVWRLDNILPTSTLKPQKHLCLSFALFKLLRCRFARYEVRKNNAGSKDILSFFWSLLLKDGEHDRVFLVISDELSFLNDYYYSSFPIYYSKYWLPILGIFISLLCIACCCFCVLLITMLVGQVLTCEGYLPHMYCTTFCIREQLVSDIDHKVYGSWYLDLVPVFFLLVLVVMAEVWDIASNICSNWTKVALICHLVNRASLQHSSLLKDKWIGRLLHCRCRMMNYWDEKIGQCSILKISPSTATLLVPLRRLLRLPDQKRKVKVPAMVKVCIMEVLRRSRNGNLSDGTACLCRRRRIGERLLWACNNKSTSRTILTWHIATSILEVRHTHLDGEEQGSSTNNYKIAATRLSGYCAYLVAWCPELLPDDDEWSRSLYEDIKKDAGRVLAGYAAGGSLTPEARCLIELLTADAKHEVLKEGARLGEQLVELMVIEGEDTAAVWNLMAEFWSEMILYVAPSDNLKE